VIRLLLLVVASVRRMAVEDGLPAFWAALIALACSSVLILAVGGRPFDVYRLLVEGTWGNAYGVGQVLFKTTPLIFTGLAVSVALKAGLFNIGAEGQLTAGAFATAMVGAALPPVLGQRLYGSAIAFVLSTAAGFFCGAAIGAIPGVLKATRGAHEVINTIMLNFIVSAVILWAGNAHFFVKFNTHTATISSNATLHDLGITGSAANTSLLLALGLAAAVAYFFNRTRRGFEWRAVGHNPRAAQNSGVRLAGVVIGAMAVSGALAGAVGANYVLGYKHYYEQGIGSGVGFMGIAVALLGRNHPAGIVVAALLLATLQSGGLAVAEQVPKELFQILQAVIILTVASASAYRGRIVKRGSVAAPVTVPADPGAPRDPEEPKHG
jgi:general nucleoside transport system permease protein